MVQEGDLDQRTVRCGDLHRPEGRPTSYREQPWLLSQSRDVCRRKYGVKYGVDWKIEIKEATMRPRRSQAGVLRLIWECLGVSRMDSTE